MKYRLFLISIIFSVLILVGYLHRHDYSAPKPLLIRPHQQLLYTGAISYFEVESGMKSFKENVNNLDLLSLFWYKLEPNGTIIRDDSVGSDRENNIIHFAHTQKKKVLLGILNYGNVKEVEDLLYNKDKQKMNIDYVINVLKEKEYDGIVIDYEGLSNKDSEAFTSYVLSLTTPAHIQGKSVSVSTIVQTTGRVFGGINIVDVSRIADRLEMQIYSQYGEESPGIIAGIDWVNSVIKNAIEQGVAPNKIILGTVDSAHDWTTSPTLRLSQVMKTSDALINLQQSNAHFYWDDVNKEYNATYTDSSGRSHIVWVEEARSFGEKQKLAKKYGLGGMFIWFLGGEDPKVWESVKQLKL